MIIKEIVGTNSDGASWLELRVNGSSVVSAWPLYECPEDATLERDLCYAFDISNLMKQAYEAGKNGEELEIIYEGDIEDESN